MKTIDLNGMVTIVTGGAGVIGGGIVRAFAEAGSKVYVADLNGEAADRFAAELTEAGLRAQGVVLDVGDCGMINRVVDDIALREGRIDHLINVAGMIISRPYMEADEADMVRTMEINLVSVDNMCRAVLRHMLPRKSGKIVNVASIAGRHGGDLLAQYSASKFAEIGLTQSIALAVAKENINVNAVCPGFIMSPIQVKLVEERARADGKTMDDIWAVQNARIPMGRFQTGEDMGNACLFLASDMARNITGQALNVDGGIRLN